MNYQVFLLVFFLIFSRALLCALCWPHQGPAQSRAAAKMRSTLHRLLKPRCPHDCPACRLASTASSGGGPAPVPLRPWSEVKSRRGAPKRIPTDGSACPNQQRLYFGVTDAHIHAAFRGWQAWPCREDSDVPRSCLPHDVQCPTPHPVVPAENPFSADRRGALDAGRKAGPFRCRACPRLPTSHHHHLADSRAGEHAQTLHESFFSHLQLPHLQLDELRTRLRNAKWVLWFWLVIDPLRTR